MQETVLFTDKTSQQRVDQWLAHVFPSYSRTYFQYLIEEGLVQINGKICKKRERLFYGDEVILSFALLPEISLEPENIPLDILYEDDDFLAINKPPFMVVHPAPGHPKGTLVNALLFHCKEISQLFADPIRPGIVHRLDKDTSGVLLAAKTPLAHMKFTHAFQNREVVKIYQAICLGFPNIQEISIPIQRHPKKRQEMTTCQEGGKPATTRLETLQKGPHSSLLQLQLITGRTHQIRVHLKHIGCPILGDPLYGSPSSNERYGVKRQMLHAHKIIFSHPKTNKIMEIHAPLPTDMKNIISYLP